MKFTGKGALLFVTAASALAACGGGGGGGGGGGIPAMQGMASDATATPLASAAPSSPVVEKEGAPVEKPLDSSWTKVAVENQRFTLASTTTVQYGANSTWRKRLLSGSVECSNATFGDPLPHVVKACYIQGPAPAPAPTAPAAGTLLAGEGSAFTVAAATLVQYGSGSSWVQKTVSGIGQCTNEFFGKDPMPFVVKACYSLGAAPGTARAPAPAPAPYSAKARRRVCRLPSSRPRR